VPDVHLGGVRLYDLLDLSTLTLFVSSDAIAQVYRPWQEMLAVRELPIADEWADAGWLLVRPDGYLAAAGARGDAKRLAGWLDRWFIRPVR
jgi:hypothetical protein